jgi:hypothetical protein
MLQYFSDRLGRVMAVSASRLFTINPTILCYVIQVSELYCAELGFLRKRVHVLRLLSVLG